MKKIPHITFITIVTLLCITAYSKPLITAQVSVDQATQKETTAHITLSKSCNNCELGFNMARQLKKKSDGTYQLTGATIQKNIGDYYLLKLKNSPTVTFTILGTMLNITDAPKGLFLVTPKGHQPVKVTHINLLTKPLSKKILRQKHLKELAQWKKQNPKSQNVSTKISLVIPMPVHITRERGSFVLTSQTKIYIEDKQERKTAQFFAEKIIKPSTNFNLTITTNAQTKNTIIFTKQGATNWMGKEGYQLQVTPHTIFIRANDAAGWFYGVQSLRQLFPPQLFAHKKASNIIWKAPCVSILDRPRFQYRGLLLDVSRHFFSKAEVERLIDLMAINKLNTFHWHLADDEGWRIQLKQFPSLTQVGGQRGYNEILPPSFGSGYGPYKGYYTEKDIKNVIQYAKERHIVIIPEIDMPGHARAMIKSLPQLHADQSGYSTAQFYDDNVLQACNEQTYTTLDKLMADIATLFPYPYIHIGSDEVPDGAWSKSPYCLKKFGAEKINKDDIQNYFLKRMHSILLKHGKYLAGWEEIANKDNLPIQTTRVYAWQSIQSGYDAAKTGYDVILVPAQHLYFDLAYNQGPREPGQYWAGYVNTFAAYIFNPLPKNISPRIAKHILGIEGALWSENLDSQKRLDYLGFPKIAALAEAAWTPQKKRNWKNFTKRLSRHYLPRLKQYGVHYRPPAQNV